MAIKEIHSPQVKSQVLSDGPIAYNVHVIYEKTTLIFACVDQAHACKLRDCLNRTSWVEVQNYQLTQESANS